MPRTNASKHALCGCLDRLRSLHLRPGRADVKLAAMTRKHAPATARNRGPILAILEKALPPEGTVLEVAAGTGEHAVAFAPALMPRCWLPSDRDAENLASIAAWRDAFPSPNLLPPVRLDVCETPWPVETAPPQPPVSAIVAINLVHIAPWETTPALMAGAARILLPGGILYLYGPYRIDGRHTAPSNAEFDRGLKARNPEWGVRDLGDVTAAARDAGLHLEARHAMPANNLSLIFAKS